LDEVGVDAEYPLDALYLLCVDVEADILDLCACDGVGSPGL
jgi:hypothetical protein